MRLVIASRNQGKIREIKAMLSDMPVEILSLSDFDNIPELAEEGSTFQENAAQKARSVMLATGLTALADDSGLEVDYLGGAPGVYSARFAGAKANDAANNYKLLKLLTGVPREKRTARFVCVIAIATPDGQLYYSEGKCEGVIGFKPAGDGGFGYDPLFIVPQYGQTFAQLPPDIKNSISHRAQALTLAREIIAGLVNEERGGV
ncbi:XTP/dITP diphosphatase [Desulfurispora thermophila]|uniref:XTP/dITP diphosphatase n=1 Tax=Desulfurispora thermophila TaxID=265470 RepID=UPI0003735676|nr:XTP/dITP diphosphatase [Desulfurispora thermophila]